jgi:hypothetical protein
MGLRFRRDHEVIAAVQLAGAWRVFSGTAGHWILDYRRYDPTEDPATWGPEFRPGLGYVDQRNAAAFCAAMAPYELKPGDIAAMTAEHGPSEYPLVVAIDFDNRVVITALGDLPIQEYVPAGWSAREGDPLQYVPQAIRDLWQPDR